MPTNRQSFEHHLDRSERAIQATGGVVCDSWELLVMHNRPKLEQWKQKRLDDMNFPLSVADNKLKKRLFKKDQVAADVSVRNPVLRPSDAMKVLGGYTLGAGHITKSHDNRFNDGFMIVKALIQKYGGIPCSVYKLKHFVHEYVTKLRSRKSKLSKEKVDKLDSIGFAWTGKGKFVYYFTLSTSYYSLTLLSVDIVII